jgi:hypothetical protein
MIEHSLVVMFKLGRVWILPLLVPFLLPHVEAIPIQNWVVTYVLFIRTVIEESEVSLVTRDHILAFFCMPDLVIIIFELF